MTLNYIILNFSRLVTTFSIFDSRTRLFDFNRLNILHVL